MKEKTKTSADQQFAEFERRRGALLMDIVSDDFPEAMHKLQHEVHDFMLENEKYDTKTNRELFKIRSQ